VFISYSHADARMLESLLPYFATLERDQLVDVWVDRDIKGGDRWSDEIDAALGAASVAVLLISQQFLASDFIYRQELPRILARQLEGRLTVLPVFLSPSTVTSDVISFIDPKGVEQGIRLAEFQGFGTPARTLKELKPTERERAFVDLYERIRELAGVRSGDAAKGTESGDATPTARGASARPAVQAQAEPSRGVPAQSARIAGATPDDARRRRLLGVAVLLAAIVAVALSLAHDPTRQRLTGAVRPWIAALQPAETLPLTAGQTRRIDAHIGRLKNTVKRELDDHFNEAKLRADPSRYSAWTLAQCALALTAHPDVSIDADRLSTFARERKIQRCECWNEMVTDRAAPQHIGISAWILFTLAVYRQPPTAGELQFLRETQEHGGGGWMMFPTPESAGSYAGLARPQGASFATAWSLLALHKIANQRLVGDPQTLDDLRKRTHDAVAFFDNDMRKHPQSGLWALYPGWDGTRETSLGTSALVLFSLHRYFEVLPGVERSPYEQRLARFDRALLRSLPLDVPKLVDSDEYGIPLPYRALDHSRPPDRPVAQPTAARAEGDTPYRTRVDSIKSLTMPWVLIGVQDAYATGTYIERVRALRFVDRALATIDGEMDAALEKYYWMAPELLMALRYLRDPHYLRDVHR
jgi:hypothetical protein